MKEHDEENHDIHIRNTEMVEPYKGYYKNNKMYDLSDMANNVNGFRNNVETTGGNAGYKGMHKLGSQTNIMNSNINYSSNKYMDNNEIGEKNECEEKTENVEIPVRGRPKKRESHSQEIDMYNYYHANNMPQFNGHYKQPPDISQERGGHLNGLGSGSNVKSIDEPRSDDYFNLGPDPQSLNEPYAQKIFYSEDLNSHNGNKTNGLPYNLFEENNELYNDYPVGSESLVDPFLTHYSDAAPQIHCDIQARNTNSAPADNNTNQSFYMNNHDFTNPSFAMPQFDSRCSDGHHSNPNVSELNGLDHRNSENGYINQRNMAQRNIDLRNIDQRNVDPRNVDTRNMDPRNMDPRNIDMRNMDPRNMDPRIMDQQFPNDSFPMKWPAPDAASHPGALSNDYFMHGNPWMNRKKRKNNPLLWQYIKQHQENYPGMMHPSNYSSLDFIHKNDSTSMKKMYLGSIKRIENNSYVEKTPNFTILPLFLNSTSFYESSMQHVEFEQIGNVFLNKTAVLDYENVTVQQLKALMKEFGLNHTGKKMDLIERVKNTVANIRNKLDDKNNYGQDEDNNKRMRITEHNETYEIQQQPAPVIETKKKTEPDKFEVNPDAFGEDAHNFDTFLF